MFHNYLKCSVKYCKFFSEISSACFRLIGHGILLICFNFLDGRQQTCQNSGLWVGVDVRVLLSHFPTMPSWASHFASLSTLPKEEQQEYSPQLTAVNCLEICLVHSEHPMHVGFYYTLEMERGIIKVMFLKFS